MDQIRKPLVRPCQLKWEQKIDLHFEMSWKLFRIAFRNFMCAKSTPQTFYHWWHIAAFLSRSLSLVLSLSLSFQHWQYGSHRIVCCCVTKINTWQKLGCISLCLNHFMRFSESIHTEHMLRSILEFRCNTLHYIANGLTNSFLFTEMSLFLDFIVGIFLFCL